MRTISTPVNVSPLSKTPTKTGIYFTSEGQLYYKTEDKSWNIISSNFVPCDEPEWWTDHETSYVFTQKEFGDYLHNLMDEFIKTMEKNEFKLPNKEI